MHTTAHDFPWIRRRARRLASVARPRSFWLGSVGLGVACGVGLFALAILIPLVFPPGPDEAGASFGNERFGPSSFVIVTLGTRAPP